MGEQMSPGIEHARARADVASGGGGGGGEDARGAPLPPPHIGLGHRSLQSDAVLAYPPRAGRAAPGALPTLTCRM